MTETQELSSHFCLILLLSVRGKALDKVKTIAVGEGFRAWQKFEEDHNPKVRTKRVGMLVAVLSAFLTGDLSQALGQFEELVADYEKSCPQNDPLPELQS